MQMRKFDKGEKKAIKYGYKMNDRAGGGRYTIQYFFNGAPQSNIALR